MRVLVTGGQGFIGHHVCSVFLKAGHQVRVIDDLSMRVQLAPEGILFANRPLSRIRDLDFGGVDFVVHCAARADVSANWDNEGERTRIWRSNIEGTIQLLEAVPPIAPIVFFSTGAIYGDATNGMEHLHYESISPYAASKLAGEAIVSAYCYKRGVPYWAFRLGCAVGAGYHHGHIVDMVVGCRRGHFHAKNDGETRKSFVNVLDVADACLGAATHRPPSGVYNLVKESWSWRDTLSVMNKMKASHERHYRVTAEERERGWVGDPMAVFSDAKSRAAGFTFKRTVEEGVVDALVGLGWDK